MYKRRLYLDSTFKQFALPETAVSFLSLVNASCYPQSTIEPIFMHYYTIKPLECVKKCALRLPAFVIE